MMKAIQMVGHIDDQHRLCLQLPDTIGSGPVKVTLELLADSSEEEDDWAAAIAQAWAADWSDPREDIYTLEDGKPEDESR
jgi:hypothetical protein